MAVIQKGTLNDYYKENVSMGDVVQRLTREEHQQEHNAKIIGTYNQTIEIMNENSLTPFETITVLKMLEHATMSEVKFEPDENPTNH